MSWNFNILLLVAITIYCKGFKLTDIRLAQFYFNIISSDYLNSLSPTLVRRKNKTIGLNFHEKFGELKKFSSSKKKR
jgi:hypothetical protein